MKITKTQLLEFINEELQINQNSHAAITPHALAHIGTNHSLINEIVLREYIRETLGADYLLKENVWGSIGAHLGKHWKKYAGMLTILSSGCLDEIGFGDGWFETLYQEMVVAVGGEAALIGGIMKKGSATGMVLSMIGLTMIITWNLKPELWDNPVAGALGLRARHTERSMVFAMTTLAIPVATSPVARTALRSFFASVPRGALGGWAFAMTQGRQLGPKVTAAYAEVRAALRARSMQPDTPSDLLPAGSPPPRTPGPSTAPGRVRLGPNEIPDSYRSPDAIDADLAEKFKELSDDVLNDLTDPFDDEIIVSTLRGAQQSDGSPWNIEFEAKSLRDDVEIEMQARATARDEYNDIISNAAIATTAPEPTVPEPTAPEPTAPDELADVEIELTRDLADVEAVVDDFVTGATARWRADMPELYKNWEGGMQKIKWRMLADRWQLIFSRIKNINISKIKFNTALTSGIRDNFEASLARFVDYSGERYVVVKIRGMTAGSGRHRVSDFLTGNYTSQGSSVAQRYEPAGEALRDTLEKLEQGYIELPLYIKIKPTSTADSVGVTLHTDGADTVMALVRSAPDGNADEMLIAVPLSEIVTRQTKNLYRNEDTIAAMAGDIVGGLTSVSAGLYPTIHTLSDQHGWLDYDSTSDQLDVDDVPGITVREADALVTVENALNEMLAADIDGGTCLPTAAASWVAGLIGGPDERN
jgi:hypothetical protein